MFNIITAFVYPIIFVSYSFNGSLIQKSMVNSNQFITLKSVDVKKADEYFESCIAKAAFKNDPIGGIAHCNRAISLNPQLANAYCWRGFLNYERFNKRPSGITDVRKCAKLARKQGDSKVLGYALSILRRWGVSE
jgi:hypothetical protein